MFVIEQGTFGTNIEYVIANLITGERVSVVPALGAHVRQMSLRKGVYVHKILNGFEKEEEFKTSQSLYINNVLIPFANRIDAGKYNFEGQDYTLAINEPARNCALHGFVFNQRWEYQNCQITDDFAKIWLGYTYSGQGIEGYPFAFSARLTIGLHSKEGFWMKLQIDNKSGQTMPLSVGWHPYFNFAEPIDNLVLDLPLAHKIETDPDRLIPTGHNAALPFTNGAPLADLFLDASFKLLEPDAAGRSISRLYSPAQKYSLCLWQQNQPQKLGYLHIYTPADRRSIALEPVSAPANVFNSDIDQSLIRLAPKTSFEASWGVFLS